MRINLCSMWKLVQPQDTRILLILSRYHDIPPRKCYTAQCICWHKQTEKERTDNERQSQSITVNSMAFHIRQIVRYQHTTNNNNTQSNAFLHSHRRSIGTFFPCFDSFVSSLLFNLRECFSNCTWYCHPKQFHIFLYGKPLKPKSFSFSLFPSSILFTLLFFPFAINYTVWQILSFI